ncbi:MAG: phytanoyl-CoA dioxygenase [Chthonomonadaceae bacterium]|nr:phytanoyl-CoA dioxygenase [Chthonomonadaceae bacterium]
MQPWIGSNGEGPLSESEVESFVQDGFVRLREAFPPSLADHCRRLLWEQMGLDPNDPTGWVQPVIRLGGQTAAPFCEAANTPRLHRAFDQLVGPGRWIAHPHLAGSVAVRFPVEGDPGDDGWHIDASFETRGSWGVNLHSDGRALLMLFLFSDVGPNDAPTRIRIGSHLDLPAMLAPVGDAGLSGAEIVIPPQVHERPLAYAVGNAGDVFLCHPFLVHAADRHHDTTPRFLAQPGLLWAERLDFERPDGAHSPVERAIRMGLGLA